MNTKFEAWKDLVNYMNSPKDFSFYDEISNIGKFYVMSIGGKAAIYPTLKKAKTIYPYNYFVEKCTHFERCFLKYYKNFPEIEKTINGGSMLMKIREKIARLIYPEIFKFEMSIVEDNRSLIKENNEYFNHIKKVVRWWQSLSESTRAKQNKIFDEIYKEIANEK